MNYFNSLFTDISKYQIRSCGSLTGGIGEVSFILLAQNMAELASINVLIFWGIHGLVMKKMLEKPFLKNKIILFFPFFSPKNYPGTSLDLRFSFANCVLFLGY